MPTDAEAIDAVSAVTDPEIERPLGELGMVKGVSVTGTAVQVMVALPAETYPSAGPLSETIGESLAALGGAVAAPVTAGARWVRDGTHRRPPDRSSRSWRAPRPTLSTRASSPTTCT